MVTTGQNVLLLRTLLLSMGLPYTTFAAIRTFSPMYVTQTLTQSCGGVGGAVLYNSEGGLAPMTALLATPMAVTR